MIGDGEEVVSEIADVVGAWKRDGKRSRDEVLRSLSHITGVYVPSLYEVTYDGDALVSVEPRFADVPRLVEKRTIADLAEWPYPKNQLVPLTEVVHDRLNVEVFRGCTRGCRFCQAGMITRPVRERPAEQVRSMIDAGVRRTGYDEIALTSLSTADFSGIESRRRRAPSTAAKGAATFRSRCPACGSTRSRSAWRRRSKRPVAPVSRSRPRPARGGCVK